MTISESQLETWSHLGSITQSSSTYNSIKNVLEANTTPYASNNYKVFLQGSYGNHTNIYAESDVDIVIRLDDTFYSDIENLSDDEKSAFNNARINATYTHDDFKNDVISVLTSQYGSAVNVGDKAIAIDANGSRRKADVIVSSQFRRYTKFNSTSDSDYIEGICFFNSAGIRIANYPKQHSANMTTKNQSTYSRLKPLARVFKNMRSRMVSDGLISSGTAPSYYIEGLLYNVPTEYFTPNYQDSVVNTLNWYSQEAIKNDLVCANWQYYLLRNNTQTCWTQTECDGFITAATRLWNEGLT